MTPGELDALLAEVEHYPGLYGGVGKQLAGAVITLREALSLIEMETRDGGQWGLRDVNEVARIALEKP